MPITPEHEPSGSRAKRRGLLLLGLAVALAAAAGVAFHRASHRGVLEKLVAARPSRAFAARLSIPVEYRKCTELPRKGDEAIPRESCGAAGGEPLELDDSATAVSSSPDSLQASAWVEVLDPNADDASLDAAIDRLARALPLSEHPAPLLVDLSGAHLVRAERTQNAQDLMVALDYAREALAAEPHNLAALFNAALAAQTFGLDDQARAAWNDYLRVDSKSEWAREARGRLRTLQFVAPPTPPDVRSSEAAVHDYAKRHPQETRELGWDDVLGEWGSAALAGDAANAAKQLAFAKRLGAALLAKPGGDQSLADAVRSIQDAADDPAATRKLARGHQAFATGMRLYQSTHQIEAKDTFALVITLRPPSPILIRSAEVFRAATLVYESHFESADSIFGMLLPQLDSVRYPALTGRAWVMKGAGRARNNKLVESQAPLETAVRFFERLGEEELTGYAKYFIGDVGCSRRDTLQGYDGLHRGLILFRGHRSSIWRHNALMMLGQCASVDGMTLAAGIAEEEDFPVAMAQDSSTPPVEVLTTRARTRVAAGDTAGALADVDSAQVRLAAIGSKPARRALEATVRYTRAVVVTDSASIVGLDSAVAFFREAKSPSWLLLALMRRAEVRIIQFNPDSADADLKTATAAIPTVSGSPEAPWLREAALEQARSTFDKLVMLRVGARDARKALTTLELGRVSLTPSASALLEDNPAAPPGQVAVEYALIGDTLLTWTVRGEDVRMLVDTIERGAFLRTVDRVNAKLEAGAREDATQLDLEYLYDVLVRPVEDRLGESGTPLIILPDGEVAGVPFAALRDSRGRKYLMEDHSLRFAASLTDAALPVPATDLARPALLVANPAFDVKANPGLGNLPGAQAEVDSLRTIYPNAIELDSSAAMRDSLIRKAPDAGVIHYAGHAVFNDARPEQSALILAGADTTGRLTAAAANRLDLRRVRLVVLSACRTLRSRQGRSGGFSGFSGALLTAGAGGVVGSPWLVDDRLAQPFMVAFHHYYRGSGDAALALQKTQIQMLHSPDTALRSPAAWAGFRYIGR